MGPGRPGEPGPRGQGLPRVGRIRLGGEIRALLREGKRHRGSGLELFTAPAPGHLPRFGSIVPRYGRTVVERNLLRRRLREIGRMEVMPRLRERRRNVDVLVRTRPTAYEASFADLKTELIRLTERLCSDASFSA